MKKADVVGRRIVDVVQEPVTDNAGKRVFDVKELVLDNGTRLVMFVNELDYEYAVEVLVKKGER